MVMKLSSITVLALLSLSPPQTQSDEIAALKREVQSLKAQQAQMQRDLETIKSILLAQRGQTADDQFVDKQITLGDQPTKGNANAKITLVEVSD